MEEFGNFFNNITKIINELISNLINENQYGGDILSDIENKLLFKKHYENFPEIVGLEPTIMRKFFNELSINIKKKYLGEKSTLYVFFTQFFNFLDERTTVVNSRNVNNINIVLSYMIKSDYYLDYIKEVFEIYSDILQLGDEKIENLLNPHLDKMYYTACRNVLKKHDFEINPSEDFNNLKNKTKMEEFIAETDSRSKLATTRKEKNEKLTLIERIKIHNSLTDELNPDPDTTELHTKEQLKKIKKQLKKIEKQLKGTNTSPEELKTQNDELSKLEETEKLQKKKLKYTLIDKLKECSGKYISIDSKSTEHNCENTSFVKGNKISQIVHTYDTLTANIISTILYCIKKKYSLFIPFITLGSYWMGMNLVLNRSDGEYKKYIDFMNSLVKNKQLRENLEKSTYRQNYVSGLDFKANMDKEYFENVIFKINKSATYIYSNFGIDVNAYANCMETALLNIVYTIYKFSNKLPDPIELSKLILHANETSISQPKETSLSQPKETSLQDTLHTWTVELTKFVNTIENIDYGHLKTKTEIRATYTNMMIILNKLYKKYGINENNLLILMDKLMDGHVNLDKYGYETEKQKYEAFKNVIENEKKQIRINLYIGKTEYSFYLTLLGGHANFEINTKYNVEEVTTKLVNLFQNDKSGDLTSKVIFKFNGGLSIDKMLKDLKLEEEERYQFLCNMLEFKYDLKIIYSQKKVVSATNREILKRIEEKYRTTFEVNFDSEMINKYLIYNYKSISNEDMKIALKKNIYIEHTYINFKKSGDKSLELEGKNLKSIKLLITKDVIPDKLSIDGLEKLDIILENNTLDESLFTIIQKQINLSEKMVLSIKPLKTTFDSYTNPVYTLAYLNDGNDRKSLFKELIENINKRKCLDVKKIAEFELNSELLCVDYNDFDKMGKKTVVEGIIKIDERIYFGIGRYRYYSLNHNLFVGNHNLFVGNKIRVSDIEKIVKIKTEKAYMNYTGNALIICETFINDLPEYITDNQMTYYVFEKNCPPEELYVFDDFDDYSQKLMKFNFDTDNQKINEHMKKKRIHMSSS